MATSMLLPTHHGDSGGDLFDACDFFRSVPCMAGELELQVQKLESRCRDDAPRSYSITNTSGHSSISMIGDDFSGDDYLDNVTLEDLAAADEFGHNVYGRHSTADSMPHAAHGGDRSASAWGVSRAPSAARHSDADTARESEGEHTCTCNGDGESSGVCPKGNAQGSSGSEHTEDNLAGPAAAAHQRGDEEQMSVPLAKPLQGSASAGGSGGGSQHDDSGLFVNLDAPGATRRTQMYRSHSYIAPRTYAEHGCFVGSNCGGGGSLRSGARSVSFNESRMRQHWAEACECSELLAPQLPPSASELELLEADPEPEEEACCRPSGLASPGPYSGCRVGSMLCSTHEAHRMVPVCGAGCGMQQQLTSATSNGADPEAAVLPRSDSAVPAAPACAAASGSVPSQLKRKASSPALAAEAPAAKKAALLQQQQQSAAGASPRRQQTQQAARGGVPPPPATAPWPGAMPFGSWPHAPGMDPQAQAAYAHGGYHHPQGGMPMGPGSGGGYAAAAMKSVRSMPANMDAFLQGYEVSMQARPQAMAPPGGAPTYMCAPGQHQPQQHQGHDQLSPNSSTASASTPHAAGYHFPQFCGPRNAGRQHQAAAPGAPPSGFGGGNNAPPPLAAAGGHAADQHNPGPRAKAGHAAAADAKRAPGAAGGIPGMTNPKPKKRASPNGNPPRAPAPNPHGHACTQCGTQVTPVWRAGPHGPKTLCNACGVRYMKVAKKK